MAEGLQRPRWRRGCLVVLTAALVAAVFALPPGYARPRSASEPVASEPANPTAPTVGILRHAGQPPESAAPNAEAINANTIAIISGNPNGTYLAIADDLSTVLDDGDAFRVLPIVGKGGAQNLRDVRYLKGIDLGITQSIILNTFRNKRQLGDIADTITYIAKLYNEEMHVIVRADSGITSINQLDGKRVNFSDVGSGTQLSARDIFSRLGVKPDEINVGQTDALKKLKAGEIAATVLIAGKPAGVVDKLDGTEGLRLLPIPFAKELQADYLPATLTSRDYPNLVEQGRSVDTIATGAVLIAYNWPRDSARYRRIENFVKHFFPRLADLQKPPRHPKWKETNLAAVIPGWKRFPAAEEWLSRHATSSPGASDQREQFDRFLESHPQASREPLTPQQRDQLYQEFLRWNEARRDR